MKKKLTTEEERQEILRQYRYLIEVWTTRKETKDLWDVRKAFRMAADAHKDMRRKSGEPFILHPIAVATIAAGEMGLGRTSIISALLHDTVEDTELTLEDVDKMFGTKVSRIIDGLTKIDEISDNNSTAQSATLKKIIFTLSDDMRVILVKLADRLHNMRTMDIMPQEKQLRISSETLYIYAPLAYRLGFFSIKSELEELSFKYSQPELYTEIKGEIDLSRPKRNDYLKDFMMPIRTSLKLKGVNAELLINEKTTYSVWQKMRQLELPFKEIFDIFSLDIVVDTGNRNESLECWAVYSALTVIYKPNTKRLRDWMSTPKANGYEAIHTTVMGPQGRWVSVHIRSKRMQEIAQKGYAAYLKYKTSSSSPGSLDTWLNKTRELLMENDESEEEEAITFIDDFKQNLFSDEIYVFTPKGDMITLPKGATVLDFAYAIHSDLGNRAIGANLNRRVVTIDYKLKSGDQVEVISSKIMKLQEEWSKIVVTARAKTKIKAALKNERKKFRETGEQKLNEIFTQLKIENNSQNIQEIMKGLEISSYIDFYYFLATAKIAEEDIKRILLPNDDRSRWRRLRIPFIGNQTKTALPSTAKTPATSQEAGTGGQKEYVISECCHPIPGDNVIILEIPGGNTEVHRTDCEKAIQLMSVYGRNILKKKWIPLEGKTYQAGLQITANDKPGLLNMVTGMISNDFQLNMSAINMHSHEGLVFIKIIIFVPNAAILKKLMTSLSKTDTILKVVRTT